MCEAGVTIRDGRVGVYGALKITVTIDTDRHGKFPRGPGCPFQRAALAGVVRRQRAAPLPLGERKASFDGRRLSKVPLRYFRKSNKG